MLALSRQCIVDGHFFRNCYRRLPIIERSKQTSGFRFRLLSRCLCLLMSRLDSVMVFVYSAGNQYPLQHDQWILATRQQIYQKIANNGREVCMMIFHLACSTNEGHKIQS